LSSEPDAHVLRRSIDEPDCFAVLFDRHFAQLHRYLRRRLGDELAAETFLQAFRSRRRFTGGDASVLAWFYGIAANLVRMNYRAEERRLRHTHAPRRISALTSPRSRLRTGSTRRRSARRSHWRWPGSRPRCAR
jgi:DNA-directed RNA polymerase specialized sigma24 family protein